MAIRSSASSPSFARGVALPVALLLLTVILLLAIAAMRSAGVGFVMAGNEQYRQNAFAASETGIEQALAFGNFNPGTSTPTNVTATVPNTTSDTYTYTVTPQLGGAPQAAIFGSSFTAFSTYHFEITSTGTSVRNAATTHVEGVAVIAPYVNEYTGPGGV
jgi:Tfp pilus assembly protein PilX